MRSLWTLVEEQKREDRLLCAEFGWGSQSGFSASQVSLQQRCQSRDAVHNQLSQYEEQTRNQVNEVIRGNSNRQLDESQRYSPRGLLMYEQTRLHSPLQGISSVVQQQPFSIEEDQSGNQGADNLKEINNSNSLGTPVKDTEIQNLKAVMHENGRSLIGTTVKFPEEEEEEEDEGIPWF